MRAIGFVVVAILAILSFGSSVLGLILFLLGANPISVRILFALAIEVLVERGVVHVDEDRRRQMAKMPLGHGTPWTLPHNVESARRGGSGRSSGTVRWSSTSGPRHAWRQQADVASAPR